MASNTSNQSIPAPTSVAISSPTDISIFQSNPLPIRLRYADGKFKNIGIDTE